MSDSVEHSAVDPRLHPMHWRFQQLFMEHTDLGRSSREIEEWLLRVHQTVKELLDPAHEVVAAAEAMMSELKDLDLVPPGFRGRREIKSQLRGPLRAQGYDVVWAAAMAERVDETVLRIVDMHPWVAEPAEPLFRDGYWFVAVTMAADNIRAQWKLILGSENKDLPSAFSLKDPKEGEPRMRFAYYDRDDDEEEWINAHEGVMHFARGCMMRIRNLYKYRATGQSISPGLAMETLATLSRLARWITDAYVEQASYPAWDVGPSEAD